MSRLSKFAEKTTLASQKHTAARVTNFMGGNSYTLSPLQTLRIVAASAIFGEPQYYREGGVSDSPIKNLSTLLKYGIFGDLIKDSKSASEVFTNAIDNALDVDFKGTLDFALELRTDFYMRLNPAVIFVRASLHPNRVKFNAENPGYMKSIGKKIAFRPDDLTNQLEYYMFLNKSKNKLPSLMKRTWAEKLAEYSRYQLNKYKGKKLIDLVRISHAWSTDIDELMKTGSLVVSDEEKTWEILRSAGMKWKEILETINIPHMALLRNMRGIFEEINDLAVAKQVVTKLKDGVLTGKQFPFRYYSAYKVVQSKKNNINHGQLLLDSLEECMDIAVANMPKLSGKTICLSDNSGSSWGAMNSEYGTTRVAEIANLSSLITAKQSDEGEVGLFGDSLMRIDVSKKNGLLSQLNDANAQENQYRRIGGGTENGIWLFFDEAISKKLHYDNIFIYSDMQAGHGGLYGINVNSYRNYVINETCIDVMKLVDTYRKTVNSRVNVFCIQVAGYDNALLPENTYRGAILAGWTGKEPVYAKAIIDAWDQIEQVKKVKQKKPTSRPTISSPYKQ